MKEFLSWSALLILIILMCACVVSAPKAYAAPPVAGASHPNPATGPANAASSVVQKFLNDRLAGNSQAAYALLTKASQKDLPATADKRDEVVKSVDDPKQAAQNPSVLLALEAMFLDFTNAMNYKIRLLGPSAADPYVVLVRAYKVDTPLSEAKIIKITA